jgi:LacI family transcriptional regulator
MRDIAEALGVSIGTVDRALHARGRISAATAARVVAKARELGYRPNLAARYLSSRRAVRIGVCLPRQLASFYDDVRAGLRDAAGPLAGSGVTLAWHPYPRLGSGEVAALRAALADGVQGLIVAPGDPDAAALVLEEASARGVPAVCVTTDAPASRRLAGITVDPRTSGAIVGELVGRFLGGHGRLAVVSGSLATRDHAEKLAGLEQALAAFTPRITVQAVLETHDDRRDAGRQASALLADRRRLDAIYVATANSIPVLREVVRAGRTDLVIVATDVFPALVPFLRNGLVAATIHQRPRTQGRLAFEALRRYLVDRIPPEPVVSLSPHVVMRANLHLFAPGQPDLA